MCNMVCYLVAWYCNWNMLINFQLFDNWETTIFQKLKLVRTLLNYCLMNCLCISLLVLDCVYCIKVC